MAVLMPTPTDALKEVEDGAPDREVEIQIVVEVDVFFSVACKDHEEFV